MRDTIYHEIMHAYIKSYGFNREYYYEEDLVTFITQNREQIDSLTDEVLKGLENEEKENKDE